VKPVIDAFVTKQTIYCSWGLADACDFAGQAHLYGFGVPRDLVKARSYFGRACSLGSVDGCVREGVVTVELGEFTRAADVLGAWERACERGSYRGCNAAGIALATDAERLGIPPDIARGRAYLAKACAARLMPACGLEAAIVVERNETSSFPAAHTQLLQACELRERESCHFLAKRELDGTFGKKDEAAAGLHFFQACRDHFGPSCAALAHFHATGIQTPVNLEKARELTSRACALGFQPSCEALQHPERQLPAP
jgi:TPR repeat protein